MRPVALLLLAASAVAGTAVHRDGRLLVGDPVSVDRGRGVVLVGKREEALDSVYLVEKDDGTLVWAPDLVARLRGYEFLARRRFRDAAARLARDAYRAKDVAQARALLELAARHGYWGKAAEKLSDRIEALARRPNVRPNPGAAAQVAAAAKRLPFLHAEVLVRRARAAKGDMRLHLLREALRRSPDAEAAKTLRREVQPKDPPLKNRVDWLDWRLDLEARGAALAPADAFGLRFARQYWRADVFGVVADPILLVTPVEDTELVGRCLAFGRLTCAALAVLFKDYPVVRKDPRPMNVLLFESRDEYKAKSGLVSAEAPALLDWTAGHYSPAERVSRFFWHKDRDAERRIVGTCVHELTHQWLRERNPAYGDPKNHPRTPGYWIVEGFATFMEEGRYDIATGRWSLFTPRSRSLDVVASLRGKKGLLPWPALLVADALQFGALGQGPAAQVRRRWALGTAKLTKTRAFYEQAAATCHFLYHGDGGRHRRALLDYVVNHYLDRGPRLTPETAFKLTGAELGAKVEAFAAAVANGWRPK